jgi:hypothetical protein
VDSEKYRSRRKQALEGLARKLAGKVRREKRPMSVEPMNPMERRILHLALQGDPYISTKSVGEGRDRKVVIFPRNYEGSLENARGESREGPSGRRPNGERRGSSRSSRAPSRSDSDRTFRRRSGPPPRKHDSFDTPAVPEGDYLMEEPDAPIVESMESEDGVQSGEE